jgi:DNA end-binding protein Ku
MARAISKGSIAFGDTAVGVKLYSAVGNRTIHFSLLHAKDHAPLEQHIVCKDTGKDVPKENMRKAFVLDRSTTVILQSEDLEKQVPPESREFGSHASCRAPC